MFHASSASILCVLFASSIGLPCWGSQIADDSTESRRGGSVIGAERAPESSSTARGRFWPDEKGVWRYETHLESASEQGSTDKAGKRRSNAGNAASQLTLLATEDFRIVQSPDVVAAYVDGGKGALAIDAAAFKDKCAAAEHVFSGPADKYHLTINTLTETDGESTFTVRVNAKDVGSFTNPATSEDYAPSSKRFENVKLKTGDVIQVVFNTASNAKKPEGDGFAYSRGRWTALRLESASGKAIERPSSRKGKPDVRILDSLYNGKTPEERDGVVSVEAEHFVEQTKTEKRRWYVVTEAVIPGVYPDGDESHASSASGGAYLEILPDTRRNHGDELITGVNFHNNAGEMAVLSYPIRFISAGRYYVWVRACFTGSEDNSVHVGLDGKWPASGQRMQWCDGRDAWRWDSKQRTNEAHCGVPHAIYLDIEKPGLHTIQFSMREDGFEFDKFLMTKDRDFVSP